MGFAVFGNGDSRYPATLPWRYRVRTDPLIRNEILVEKPRAKNGRAQ